MIPVKIKFTNLARSNSPLQKSRQINEIEQDQLQSIIKFIPALQKKDEQQQQILLTNLKGSEGKINVYRFPINKGNFKESNQIRLIKNRSVSNSKKKGVGRGLKKQDDSPKSRHHYLSLEGNDEQNIIKMQIKQQDYQANSLSSSETAAENDPSENSPQTRQNLCIEKRFFMSATNQFMDRQNSISKNKQCISLPQTASKQTRSKVYSPINQNKIHKMYRQISHDSEANLERDIQSNLNEQSSLIKKNSKLVQQSISPKKSNQQQNCNIKLKTLQIYRQKSDLQKAESIKNRMNKQEQDFNDIQSPSKEKNITEGEINQQQQQIQNTITDVKKQETPLILKIDVPQNQSKKYSGEKLSPKLVIKKKTSRSSSGSQATHQQKSKDNFSDEKQEIDQNNLNKQIKLKQLKKSTKQKVNTENQQNTQQLDYQLLQLNEEQSNIQPILLQQNQQQVKENNFFLKKLNQIKINHCPPHSARESVIPQNQQNDIIPQKIKYLTTNSSDTQSSCQSPQDQQSSNQLKKQKLNQQNKIQQNENQDIQQNQKLQKQRKIKHKFKIQQPIPQQYLYEKQVQTQKQQQQLQQNQLQNEQFKTNNQQQQEYQLELQQQDKKQSIQKEKQSEQNDIHKNQEQQKTEKELLESQKNELTKQEQDNNQSNNQQKESKQQKKIITISQQHKKQQQNMEKKQTESIENQQIQQKQLNQRCYNENKNNTQKIFYDLPPQYTNRINFSKLSKIYFKPRNFLRESNIFVIHFDGVLGIYDYPFFNYLQSSDQMIPEQINNEQQYDNSKISTNDNSFNLRQQHQRYMSGFEDEELINLDSVFNQMSQTQGYEFSKNLNSKNQNVKEQCIFNEQQIKIISNLKQSLKKISQLYFIIIIFPKRSPLWLDIRNYLISQKFFCDAIYTYDSEEYDYSNYLLRNANSIFVKNPEFKFEGDNSMILKNQKHEIIQTNKGYASTVYRPFSEYIKNTKETHGQLSANNNSKSIGQKNSELNNNSFNSNESSTFNTQLLIDYNQILIDLKLNQPKKVLILDTIPLNMKECFSKVEEKSATILSNEQQQEDIVHNLQFLRLKQKVWRSLYLKFPKIKCHKSSLRVIYLPSLHYDNKNFSSNSISFQSVLLEEIASEFQDDMNESIYITRNKQRWYYLNLEDVFIELENQKLKECFVKHMKMGLNDSICRQTQQSSFKHESEYQISEQGLKQKMHKYFSSNIKVNEQLSKEAEKQTQNGEQQGQNSNGNNSSNNNTTTTTNKKMQSLGFQNYLNNLIDNLVSRNSKIVKQFQQNKDNFQQAQQIQKTYSKFYDKNSQLTPKQQQSDKIEKELDLYIARKYKSSILFYFSNLQNSLQIILFFVFAIFI